MLFATLSMYKASLFSVKKLQRPNLVLGPPGRIPLYVPRGVCKYLLPSTPAPVGGTGARVPVALSDVLIFDMYCYCNFTHSGYVNEMKRKACLLHTRCVRVIALHTFYKKRTKAFWHSVIGVN